MLLSKRFIMVPVAMGRLVYLATAEQRYLGRTCWGIHWKMNRRPHLLKVIIDIRTPIKFKCAWQNAPMKRRVASFVCCSCQSLCGHGDTFSHSSIGGLVMLQQAGNPSPGHLSHFSHLKTCTCASCLEEDLEWGPRGVNSICTLDSSHYFWARFWKIQT